MTKIEKQKKIEEIIDLMKNGKSKKDLISLGFSLNLRKEAERLYNQRKSDEEFISKFKVINNRYVNPKEEIELPRNCKFYLTKRKDFPLVIKSNNGFMNYYVLYDSDNNRNVRISLKSIAEILCGKNKREIKNCIKYLSEKL